MGSRRLPPFNPLTTAAVEYLCLDFPFQPWQLIVANSRGQRSEKDGASCVEWLASIEVGRTSYIDEFFADACVALGPPHPVRKAVEQFEHTLQPWIRRVFEPMFGTFWFYKLPNGAPSFAPLKTDDHDDARALQISLAVDVAFWVIARARETKDLEWVMSEMPFGTKLRSGEPLSYLPTLFPGSANVYPISEGYGLISASLARPGSRSETRLRVRRSAGWTRLGSLYDALITGYPIGGPIEEY
jgi:hypothetical protein